MKLHHYLTVLFTGFLLSCNSMGSDPEGERQQRIVQSSQYNAEKGKFENPVVISLSTGRPWTTILYEMLFNGEGREPSAKLPEEPPALSEFNLKSKDTRFIWFGHSTLLLEIDSKRILIDPVFSDYAAPFPVMVKRFQAPVFNIDQIPDVDIVLISHDHYDHLDYETISKLKKRDIQYIAPLGVGAHLESWGIDKNKITELDWWDSDVIQGLQFTCTPSQHFSGRGMFNRNSTLWSSWSIHGESQRIFYSGDSGYAEHYKEIGERLGPFDLTFLENGAYSLDWKFVHQLPEEGVQAHIDLQGKTMVPVHWGMFNLALHTWYDPVIRVTTEAERRGVKVLVPKLGQLVTNMQNYVQQDWWIPVIEPPGLP